MKKTVAIALLTTSLASTAQGNASWHKSFAQEMERMEKAFDHLWEHMEATKRELADIFAQEAFMPSPTLNITIEEKEQDSLAAITVEQLKTDGIEATINHDEDQLKIKASENTITVATKEKLLTISHTTEKKREEKQDNEIATISSSFGSYSTTKLLSEKINIEKANISYDSKNKQLTILIPFFEKKKDTKKIPITIK